MNTDLSDTFLQQNCIPRTVTAMFKDAPAGMLLEAWRVLLMAVGELALFPEEVAAWHTDVTWANLHAPTLADFTKYDLNGRTWFANDADPAVFFFVDDATSSGWKQYWHDLHGIRRSWWHNDELSLYFFDTSQ